MDDLTQYIYANYGRLLTRQEANVFADIYKEVKAQAPYASGGAIMHWIFAAEQAGVRVSISREQEASMLAARERVLREHASEVVLNRCPRCGSLTRTPRAKQCMKCFFGWHEEGSRDQRLPTRGLRIGSSVPSETEEQMNTFLRQLGVLR